VYRAPYRCVRIDGMRSNGTYAESVIAYLSCQVSWKTFALKRAAGKSLGLLMRMMEEKDCQGTPVRFAAVARAAHIVFRVGTTRSHSCNRMVFCAIAIYADAPMIRSIFVESDASLIKAMKLEKHLNCT